MWPFSKNKEQPETASEPSAVPEPVASDPASSEAAPEEAGSSAAATTEPLDERIVEALKTVYDPEIPVDIYELGLIYDVAVDEAGNAHVKMTLTSPHCPVAGTLPGEVEDKVRSVEGTAQVTVDLVWDPAWNPSMMSEAARLELGMF